MIVWYCNHYAMPPGVGGAERPIRMAEALLSAGEEVLVAGGKEKGLDYRPLLPLLEKLKGRMPSVTKIVVATEEGFEGWTTDLPGAEDYENFIAGKPEQFEWPQIDNTLVRNKAIFAGVQYRVGILQTHRNIVRTEYCHFGGPAQSFTTHHPNVHPANRQNARRAKRRGRDHRRIVARPVALLASDSRQKRREMSFGGNRTDSRATAAVGNTKCFMQIQMRNIAAKFAWLAKPHHGIEIGPIDIYLPAMAMHDIGNFTNMRLKNAMC